MSHRSHHTPLPCPQQQSQVLDEPWEEVLGRLPADYEVQASRLGAFVRKRELRSVGDLLRAVLAYVLGGSTQSFRRLGAWAVLIGLADISETAWRKRMQRASAWLLWLLQQLVAAPALLAPTSVPRACGRVLLVDATRLQEEGSDGEEWRVQTAYDLAAGRLAEVVVTDRHSGESLLHYHLQPGDVVVADNGYGYRRSVAVLRSQEADGVLHLTPSSFPVQDEHGQRIDLIAWLRQARSSLQSLSCWCEWEGQCYAVRVVAMALMPQAAERARDEKRERARSRGTSISQQTLFLAGWVLVVTTLPAQQWSEADVLQLYRARWQIELVYKRLKQLLHISQVRAHTVETAQAVVRAMMVAWVLQEEEAAQLRQELLLVQTEGPLLHTQIIERPLSSWLLSAICLDTLRMQVQGQWTSARLHACRRALLRFVGGSPRRRRQHETVYRQWVSTAPLVPLSGQEEPNQPQQTVLSLRL